MISVLRRWMRRSAPLVLALGIMLSPAPARQAFAQVPDPNAPAEGGDGEKGRPLDGYLGTLCLVMLVFFIVGKSARR
jgi:hypothetical protein